MKTRYYFLFHGLLIATVIFTVSWRPAPDGFDCASCAINGFVLKGNIQEVDAFPDVKVQVVDAFPDLKVKTVDAFPDECGKWKFVDAFPDVKVQFVDAFPDVKIQYVDAFPGCN